MLKPPPPDPRRHPDGKVMMREFKAGDVMWSDAQTHIGENVGDTLAHVIMIEMK
jgi:beta-alanine degradation protein BauB